MSNTLSLDSEWAGHPNRLPLRILQFGAGNFIRAFVDWMVEVLNEEAGFNAGVVVVKPTAGGDYEALRAQDGLFHVLCRGLQNGEALEEFRLIKCIQQVIHASQNWDAFLATAQIPSLNIITSNTTEAGIQFVAADRFEDTPPSAFPAKLTCWLHRRFQYFEGRKEAGCVLLPCEHLDDNGDKLQAAVLQYAEHWRLGDSFGRWLKTCNTFCNTLVDRIVPGYPEDGLDYCQKVITRKDELLVVAEPFHLWAIQQQPGLEALFPVEQCSTSVQLRFVENLELVRTQKIRILNGLHTIMVSVGLTHGLSTVAQTAAHDYWGPFLKTVAQENIFPTLPLPEKELQAYLRATFERFLNPFIEHRLQSIALNSIAKFRVRVLPSLLHFYSKYNTLPEGLVFALACLLKLYDRKELPFRDDSEAARRLQAYWAARRERGAALKSVVDRMLSDNTVWGRDLSPFRERTVAHLQQLEA